MVIVFDEYIEFNWLGDDTVEFDEPVEAVVIGDTGDTVDSGGSGDTEVPEHAVSLLVDGKCNKLSKSIASV